VKDGEGESERGRNACTENKTFGERWSETHGVIEKERERQTNKQTDKEMDRETDREMDRERK